MNKHLKIVARLNKNSQELLEQLREQGLDANPRGEHIFVNLPQSEDDANRFTITPALKSATIMVCAAEHDGARKIYSQEEDKQTADYSIRGSATVVCNPQGRRLAPYKTHAGRLGVHGYFSCQNAIVTICGFSHQFDVLIYKHTIIRNGDKCWIRSEKIFDGKAYQLPEALAHFQSAIAAAQDKSNCTGCRHLHYAFTK